MPADAPARTLTFLFSDIEGSTRLWERYPGAMRLALARHDAVLHDAIREAGGEVVKTTGDGVMAVFTSARECLLASVAAQLALQREAWGDTGPLLVRMGIHTGEVPASGGDFHGPAVNRAARIMSAAHGGQVLLSAATWTLVGDALPEGWSLRDLGEHQLKGIGRPERLYQLVHPDLPSTFSALATLGEGAHALPADSSAFVGRQRELQELISRLRQDGVRLITLTGPGGIGKTRLALRAASDLQASYEAAVFVDVSTARDTDAVLLSIARQVGLPDRGEQAQLDQLVGHLRERRLLLLLDNFEQVTQAAAAIAQLLEACPGLQVVVTSREPLRIRGEHLFAVPPLGLPETEHRLPSTDELLHYEAIALFVERARTVQPDFRLTDDNAATVVEICRRLDGLPLAIELATARIGTFTPETLRERLDNRLKLLRSGPRDLPERQQTLRATIEWSHQLLEPTEQELFAVLAAFSGASLADVEAVVERLPVSSAELDPLDALASLVDKSLVRRTELAGGASRFAMLETIREYALERLEDDPEQASAVRRAHAEHFAELAIRESGELDGPGRERTIRRLATERENLAGCWHYWIVDRAMDRLDALVDALWPLYDAKGWYRAMVGLATGLLAVLADTPLTRERRATEVTLLTSLARALMAMDGYTAEVERAYARALEMFGADVEAGQQLPVLRGLASFHLYRAEFEQSAEFGRRILELAESSGDLSTAVHGRLILGASLMFIGDVAAGLRELDLAIQTFETHGYRPGRYRLGSDPRVVALTTSAFGYWLCGDPAGSLERADRALDMAASLDHPWTLAYARFHTGLLHLWRSEPEVVRDRALGVLQVADEVDLPMWQAIGSCLLGAASTALDDPETGLALLHQGLERYRALTTPPVFWPELLYLNAWACHRAGRVEDGLRLIDEAAALEGGEGHSPMSPELHLLRGDLLALGDGSGRGPHDEYVLAHEIATDMGLHMSRLRAALRLARAEPLAADDPERWRAALADAYATFSGDLQDVDLVAARALLADAGSGSTPA